MQIKHDIADDLWQFSRRVADLQEVWDSAVKRLKSWTEMQDNANLQVKVINGEDPNVIRAVFASVHLELRMQLCKDQGKASGLLDIVEIDRFKEDERLVGQLKFDGSGMTDCHFEGSNTMANIHALPALILTLADQVLQDRAKRP